MYGNFPKFNPRGCWREESFSQRSELDDLAHHYCTASGPGSVRFMPVCTRRKYVIFGWRRIQVTVDIVKSRLGRWSIDVRSVARCTVQYCITLTLLLYFERETLCRPFVAPLLSCLPCMAISNNRVAPVGSHGSHRKHVFFYA